MKKHIKALAQILVSVGEQIEPSINFEMDLKFWALYPCVNLNLHMKEIEIEWFCFGMYVSYKHLLNKKQS